MAASITEESPETKGDGEGVQREREREMNWSRDGEGRVEGR